MGDSWTVVFTVENAVLVMRVLKDVLSSGAELNSLPTPSPLSSDASGDLESQVYHEVILGDL